MTPTVQCTLGDKEKVPGAFLKDSKRFKELARYLPLSHPSTPLPLFQFTLVDLSGFRPPSHPPPALVSLYESIYLTNPSRDNAKKVIKHYITSFMSASDDNVKKVVKDFFLRKMMIFSSFLEDDEIDHNHINQVVKVHPWLSNTLLGPHQWLSYEVEIHFLQE